MTRIPWNTELDWDTSQSQNNISHPRNIVKFRGEVIIDSFEDDTVGNAPQDWEVGNDGSSVIPSVVDSGPTPFPDGSRAVRSHQANTGSPSNFDLYNTVSPTSQWTITFDAYIDEKANTGSVDRFSLSLRDANRDESSITAGRVNLVGSDGSSIRAQDGTNVVSLESSPRGEWVTVGMSFDFPNDQYSVLIDANEYGPFGFMDSGDASDFTTINHHNDNYDGYIDYFRTPGPDGGFITTGPKTS